jgi:hypothetical protein
MPTFLQSRYWALGLLAIAWSKPATGCTQRFGSNLVTNGTFSTQPAGTKLAPSTDLGGWVSGRAYTSWAGYAARGQVSGPTGTDTVASNYSSQVPCPGDPASGVAASATWLHYSGQATGTIIWRQPVANR